MASRRTIARRKGCVSTPAELDKDAAHRLIRPRQPERRMTVERSHFGTLGDGRAVEKFTLRNARGASAEVLTFGATIKSFRPAGSARSILLGYDALVDYVHDGAHHGGFMGRYANRIAHGEIEIDGRQNTHKHNKNKNTQHNNNKNNNHKIWSASVTDDGVRLAYT